MEVNHDRASVIYPRTGVSRDAADCMMLCQRITQRGLQSMSPFTRAVVARLCFTSVASLLSFAGWTQHASHIGVAPVALTGSSYAFASAEQQWFRVVVVAKGLIHPFSLALLPSGDEIVSGRGVALRIVHNVGASAGVGSSASAS